MIVAAIYVVVLVVILVSSSWAGQGWYLLSPNIGLDGDTLAESNSGKLLKDEPISKWHHEGAFDSAKECNRRLEENFQRVLAQWKDKEKMRATRPWLLDLFFGQAQAARCVATDDPRLR